VVVGGPLQQRGEGSGRGQVDSHVQMNCWLKSFCSCVSVEKIFLMDVATKYEQTNHVQYTINPPALNFMLTFVSLWMRFATFNFVLTKAAEML